ncbi:hypothetical protein K402DRAFT_424524 [Aulographum hederae CBS 113979]|uniref:DUF1996 domain-containing protein n=1 Tax=Aulographum hederae CBS 113979 TaxID=1176131 RepID=A0A6G1GN80_9PEZI|nr:hypothetical protein K402DRAFT_424524 [Aulographum hederae CBS 113979]
MRTTSTLFGAFVASVTIPGTKAYFRLSCSISQTSRIDPILAPVGLSAHVHKFSGASIRLRDLRKANCTTCEIQEDKSAYWTPQLYYQHGNRTFQEVPNEGMTVYYLGRGDNRMNIVLFPPSFRMITDDSTCRSYDTGTRTFKADRPVGDRVTFACLGNAPSKEQNYMKETDCVNGLHAQLFFEVLYGVNDIKKTGGKFTFANGDTTGYSFHGDFMNGWNIDVLKAAIGDCLNADNGGAISSCPSLAKS